MERASALPIPLSLIAGRYLCFSIDAVTYLRREHHICGVLIGSIPHFPQQNVFHGLPLQLMPEEVRLLVEKGLAYVVDDAIAHQQALLKTSTQKRRQYVKMLRDTGRQAAILQAGIKTKSRVEALSKSRSKATMDSGTGPVSRDDDNDDNGGDDDDDQNDGTVNAAKIFHEESLFAPSNPSRPDLSNSTSVSHFGITPATSALLLTPLPSPFISEDRLPAVPDSYPLFKHLHSMGYFLLPGLTFGCHYTVYPGDPLRFHSHFLASYVGWDEELDLIDLVGGGRLGTVEKKGYLIGSHAHRKPNDVDQSAEGMRTFSIEWASM